MVHSFHAIPCSNRGVKPCKLGLIGGPREGGLSVCFPGLFCVPGDLETELRGSETVGQEGKDPPAAEAEGRPLGRG